MKAASIILFEMLFFAALANAQHVLVVPAIEKTVAGNQYGFQLLFESKYQWSFGGFYQTSWQQTAEGVHAVNPFYGLTVNAPVIKSNQINFYLNIRGGVVNQHFLVVAPGLETSVKVSRWIRISTLMSVRMSYPSASLKIYITL